MLSEGYSTIAVRLSLCYAQQNGPKTMGWVQCDTDFILKIAILVKMLHSKVTARRPSEQANMLISTGLA